MREAVVSSFLASFQHNYLVPRAINFSNEKWQVKLKKPKLQYHIKPKAHKYLVRNELASTYSARVSTDIPLYEIPGALFDDYLEDKPKIFKAMFPDKSRSHQLNQDEWRVQMLNSAVIGSKRRPVVDLRLRCKSGGRDYPPKVPRDITKILELDIVSKICPSSCARFDSRKCSGQSRKRGMI